ncbi:hypothetical protein Ddye_000772 [Dipteronia dyeriana]|uniref:Uncharacterized protein n=1 Tax=Dipteronia dyeriana TaxID=168575 RepID=A0AAD9XNN7_9ROSI|nr:hypothetical protein Ddye_000772 [Dipteronia dyeriana]
MLGVGRAYTTNLPEKTCECGQWQVSGVSYNHALIEIRYHFGVNSDETNLVEYIDQLLSKSAYLRTYNSMIHPIPDLCVWADLETASVDTPPLKRLIGRPRLVRKRESGEKQKVGKTGTVVYRNCRRTGHNSRSYKSEITAAVTKRQMAQKGKADVGSSQTTQGEIKSEAKLSIVNCVDEINVVMYIFKKFGGGDTTWITKTVKDVLEVESSPIATTPTIMQVARYGALTLKCSKLSYYTTMSNDGYKQANMAIEKLTIQLKGLLPLSSTATDDNVHSSREESSNRVKDPVIATAKRFVRQNKKTSGKTRKCGKCRQLGHTANTCHSYVQNDNSAVASNGDIGPGPYYNQPRMGTY